MWPRGWLPAKATKRSAFVDIIARSLSAFVQLKRRLEEEIVNLHVELIVDPHADDARRLVALGLVTGAATRRRRIDHGTIDEIRHGRRRDLHL